MFAISTGSSAEVQAAQPSVIFHLAARALVRRAYEEPRDTFETNVMGTVNVLEAARACPSVQAVVVVTSDKVYENPETGRAFREADPLGGRDPYGASKGAAELVTAAYRESFFADGAAVASRPRRQRHRRRRLGARPDHSRTRCAPWSPASPIVVRNPDAIRPWQHVLEPLSGYLRLGALLLDDGRRYAGRLELRPDRSSGRISRSAGSSTASSPSGAPARGRPRPATEGQPHEAQRLSLDSSKAREQLGWAPVWDAPTAVRRTAAWYREYYRAPASARDARRR